MYIANLPNFNELPYGLKFLKFSDFFLKRNFCGKIFMVLQVHKIMQA